MDNLVGNRLKERSASREAKTMKKPMKVVYISNPMRFKISASKFMELVQQLTGQDSELPADPSNFLDGKLVDGDENQPVLDCASKTDDRHAPAAVLDLSVDQQTPPQRRDVDDDTPMLDSPSDDDYFIPQMIDNFSTTNGFMYSSLFYEATTSTTADLDVPRK